jgi:hypothetical protein
MSVSIVKRLATRACVRVVDVDVDVSVVVVGGGGGGVIVGIVRRGGRRRRRLWYYCIGERRVPGDMDV